MAIGKVDLPTDLISNIFFRLPVKTLFRFKCVSKPWCNLISSPLFLHWHHDRSQNQKPLQLFSEFLFPRRMGKCEHRLSFYVGGNDGPLHDKCEIILDDFCHLLSCYRGSLFCYVANKSIFICNPSTREFLTLPKGSHCEDGSYLGLVGFAYLPLENEYKVVRLFYKHKDKYNWLSDFQIGCEILTLRDGGIVDSFTPWRVVQDQRCPYPVDYNYPPSVNESIHWLVHYEYCTNFLDEFDDDKLIVSFNVKAEKFKMIPAPKGCLRLGNFSVTLTELSGFLVLVSGFTEAEIDIWVLKDYDNQFWLKEYRIDISGMDGFDLNGFDYAIPKDIQDGEILMESNCKRLDYYNIETKKFRNLYLDRGKPAGKINKCWKWFQLNFYWQSFFLLGSS